MPVPALCRVPALTGLTKGAAVRRLRAAHCAAGKLKKFRAGRVIKQQSPAAGTIKKRGSTVDLTFKPQNTRTRVSAHRVTAVSG